MKKIYAEGYLISTSEPIYEIINDKEEIIKNEGKEYWDTLYKELCNYARYIHDLEGLLAMSTHKKEKKTLLLIFKCNNYDKHYVIDEDEEGYFIVVEDEE